MMLPVPRGGTEGVVGSVLLISLVELRSRTQSWGLEPPPARNTYIRQVPGQARNYCVLGFHFPLTFFSLRSSGHHKSCCQWWGRTRI